MDPRIAFSILTVLIAASCSSGDDSKRATTPSNDSNQVVPIEPPPEKVSLVEPAIASVLLVQDCPDLPATTDSPTKEDVKAAAPVRSRRELRKAGSEPLRQPCTQSSLQIAFNAAPAAPVLVVVRELRLLSADGKPLATLQARMPTIWNSGRYIDWDGTLPAAADQKISFKMSIPDWTSIETTLGSGSFDVIFQLEADIVVDGVETTVKSPQFERGRPMIIRT